MSEKKKKLVAYHEAGHAILGDSAGRWDQEMFNVQWPMLGRFYCDMFGDFTGICDL